MAWQPSPAGLLAEHANRLAWGDPRDELVARLGRALDELGRGLIDGDGRSTGLRAWLGREAGERWSHRRAALLQALRPGDDP